MRARLQRIGRTPTRWTTILAIVGFVLAVGSTSWAAPAREAAVDVVATAKRALKVGQRADRNAREALRVARVARESAKPGATGPQGAAGAQGARGFTGAPGANGSGLGYAQIEYCAAPPCEDFGEVGWFSSDDTNSPGIDNHANFMHRVASTGADKGIFCYYDLPFTPHVVMASTGPIGDVRATTTPKPAYLVQGRAGSTDHPLVECGFAAGVNQDRTAAVFVRDMSGTPTGTLTDPDTGLRIFVLFG
jgi:hypothetical protein